MAEGTGGDDKQGGGLGSILLPLVTLVIGFAAGHVASDFGWLDAIVGSPQAAPTSQTSGGSAEPRDAGREDEAAAETTEQDAAANADPEDGDETTTPDDDEQMDDADGAAGSSGAAGS